MIDTQLLITKRTERGLSQRQLAKHAGVGRETIRRLENGADPDQLPLGVIFRMAAALNVEAGDLLLRHVDDADDVQPSAHVLDYSPLDHNAAKLLRRVARGDDIRRTMSRAERELLLPSLLNRGLVLVTSSGVSMAPMIASL